MGKQIFGVYLAKEGVPDNEAHAKLDLPAASWELWDAMDKVRLQDGETLYLEIDEYYRLDALAPHLVNMDIGLNELNDLAGHLAKLDEVQGIAYQGVLEMAVQEKVQSNGGIITMQELRDLAVSAGEDCCHVVDAADDAQLGRFYAENDFVPELEGVPDVVFDMLDFARIGKALRTGEGGVYVGSCYVVQDGGLLTAPPCPRELPEKPGYLFRLTLGLHPDYGDDRTVTLDLPASEEDLEEAQERLGTLQWENTVVLDYDGIIPYALEFADLPAEMEAFNEFAKAVKEISARQVQLPKLKALLEQFEVQDIGTAILLTERIRKTSVDELPQLVNVLKGDMAIVGPRPPLTYHPWPIDQYTEEQLHMFDVRPGITGWAQVNGRKTVEWPRRIELSVYYARNLTLAFDIKILALTVLKVLRHEDNVNTGATV